MDERSLLYSLRFYLSARQSALISAFSARCQLSPFALSKLRSDYSNYLSSIVSAIELVRESSPTNSPVFLQHLEAHFVFPDFPDGKQNYGYLRELRNAIVHRGLDITSEATVLGNFPIPILPPFMSSRDRGKVFARFGSNLLEVICNCESAVGPTIKKYLTHAGHLPIRRRPSHAVRQELQGRLEQAEVMTSRVRALSSAHTLAGEYLDLMEEGFTAELEVLFESHFAEALWKSCAPPA
jgi:hypothetical protein